MDDFTTWLQWALGIVVTAIFGAIGWFFKRIVARLDDIERGYPKAAQDAETVMAARVTSLEAAHAESMGRIFESLEKIRDFTEAVDKDVKAYKLEAEKRYATKTEIEKSEHRLEKALDRLTIVLDRMDGRN